MRLQSLIQNYPNAHGVTAAVSELADLEISGICEDSRQVRAGDLFIARPGIKTDGRKFIEDAKSRGAVAVISHERLENCPLPQVVISDPAVASVLANLFHNRPSHTVRVLGVTGTNGKTTTAYLMRHLLNKLEHRCGMIGTVEIDDGRQCTPSSMTTPGAIEMAELLGRMRDHDCRACAVEVSSHALHQHRAAGIRFAGAGFTNLTGDHLDYHKTMENYAAAKAMLFSSLAPDAVAAVNCDDPASDRMIHDCAARLVRFSATGHRKADYRAADVQMDSRGTRFTLHTPDAHGTIEMALIGRHNIENALCAASVAGEVFHLSIDQIAAGLRDAGGAPGRLQAVKCGQPFTVLVDYAHTDDALANVLNALRPLTRGALRVCFGCGGDRDNTKRPRMAAVAHELADQVYITSDNPRTEDPQTILNQIVAGLPSHEKLRLLEANRRRAIEQILADAQGEDVVLIAGKGHENYQEVAGVKHHFDDVEECERVLLGRKSEIRSPKSEKESGVTRREIEGLE